MISGMALGWDTAWAIAALQCGISLHAAVPFQGQERKWPEAAQQRYRDILTRAAEVTVVTPGGYSTAAMHRRNEWMVDNCDGLVALWNGSPGGTSACVNYAARVKRPWVNLWPQFAG